LCESVIPAFGLREYISELLFTVIAPRWKSIAVVQILYQTEPC
jgi:hypothetical protein